MKRSQLEGGRSRCDLRSSFGMGFASALVFVGCSADDGDSGDVGGLEELVLAAEAAGADTQADAIRDGVVTDEELLEAVRAARSCVEGLGLSVSAISRGWDGSLSYSFSAGGESAVVDADMCQSDESTFVEQAYKIVNGAPDFGPVLNRFNGCMSSLGLEPVEASSRSDLRTVIQSQGGDQEVLDCYASAFPSTIIEE